MSESLLYRRGLSSQPCPPPGAEAGSVLMDKGSLQRGNPKMVFWLLMSPMVPRVSSSVPRAGAEDDQVNVHQSTVMFPWWNPNAAADHP